MGFLIHQDVALKSSAKDFNEAQAFVLDALKNAAEPTTFTVSDNTGALLYGATTRRIEGRFVKQVWGGRKGNDAIYVSDETFDATDHVLRMRRAEIEELEDNSTSTDEIGLTHIRWDGPHEVQIVDSIKRFFGVADLEDVTPPLLHSLREAVNPVSPRICPNCGQHPVGNHPETGCVLAGLIQVLRERSDLDESRLQELHAGCDTDVLWSELGPIVDRIERGEFSA